VEPDTKFVPMSVNWNWLPPAVAAVGDIEVRVGTVPAPIEKVAAFELTVPFETVTRAEPAFASRVAGMVAVS
jgi:hypothetical protein